MRTFIYPYKIGSKSAISVADGLDCLMLKPTSPYSPKKRDVVINWGQSKKPTWITQDLHVVNKIDNVALAANKLKTFQKFKEHDIACPEWTTNVQEALDWLPKNDIVVRQKLTGHSGQGIVLVNKGTGELPQAPLYVKYKKKAREFRAHVFAGEVIDIQEKRKKSDFEGERNSKIRSYDNGWVFCREDLDVPDDLRDLAVLAVSAVGLDFGAVDIIYNGHEQRCFALEVNTAPGLEGETMFSYVCAILTYLESL